MKDQELVHFKARERKYNTVMWFVRLVHSVEHRNHVPYIVFSVTVPYNFNAFIFNVCFLR